MKLFDHVYIKPTNAVGVVIWVEDGNPHKECRTDTDGMQADVDLELLTLEHLKIPGLHIPHDHVKWAARYYPELPNIGQWSRSRRRLCRA